MANFYLDTSAIGNEYQSYSATPTTWAKPQDGNGKAASAASAAVAIATLDCASATGSGSNTMSILGVSVANTSTASGATLATSLAASINASSTAVSATYSIALLPLNSLVYARVNPGLTTQVQIMMRIAGADWNGNTPTSSGFTVAPTIGTFAGGVDGPFSYAFSTSAIFGKSIYQWGVLSITNVGGKTDIAATDTIYCRTARASVDCSVVVSTASNISVGLVPSSKTRNVVFDDGTIWSDGTSAGQFQFDLWSTSGAAPSVLYADSTTATGTLRLISADQNKRARIYYGGSIIGAWGVLQSSGSTELVLENILCEAKAASIAGTLLYFKFIYSGGARLFCDKCKFVAKSGAGFVELGATGGTKRTFNNCEFEYFALTGNVSGLISGSVGTNELAEFTGCRFYDRNGVYSITAPVALTTGGDAPFRVTFDGCSGISDVAINVAGTTASERVLVWDNYGSNRDFRTESGVWLTEWRSGNNQATLSAQLPNGNPWSLKSILRAANTWNMQHKLARIFSTYRGATGSKKLTVEVLSQVAFKVQQLGLLVVYMDKDNVVRTESTFTEHILKAIIGGGTSVAASAAVWTLNGNAGYTAYKLELTTAYQIKSGAEVSVYVIWRGPLVSDATVFTNPEVAYS